MLTRALGQKIVCNMRIQTKEICHIFQAEEEQAKKKLKLSLQEAMVSEVLLVKKSWNSRVQHGAVEHEEALGKARKGIKV